MKPQLISTAIILIIFALVLLFAPGLEPADLDVYTPEYPVVIMEAPHGDFVMVGPGELVFRSRQPTKGF